jgi:hypothetical protein
MVGVLDAMLVGIPDMTPNDRAVFTKYRDQFIKTGQLLSNFV